MSKSIDAHLSQLRFPSTCVVCMSPASTQFELEKMFSYGRKTYTVKVKVPMCNQHFEAASFKGTAERFMDAMAIAGGLVAGLLAVALLYLRWVGENGLLTKLFVGAMVGFGFFILVWWIISSSIVPLFATRESKEARNAVRITRYWPHEGFVRLDFENEQLAEIVQRSSI